MAEERRSSDNPRAKDAPESGNRDEKAQSGNGQQFAVQRIYVKDVSFEAPMGVDGFSRTWKPQVNQEINTKNHKIGDTLYEVILSLTVTVKLEDKVAFLIEIQQAGLFSIKGLEEKQLTQLLNTMCLQILFPYARETIDSLAIKGSFPALMLPPINFDALFAQAVARSQEEKADGQDQAVN